MVYVKVVDAFTNLFPRFAGYFLKEEDVDSENYIFAWKSRNGMDIWKIPFHSTLQQQKRYKILKMTNITYLIIYFRMQRWSTYSFLLGKCDILLAFCYILKVRKDLWILRLLVF